MLVDDSIVLKYINGENVEKISSHWVFENIEEGKHLFHLPDYTKREEVNSVLKDFRSVLSEFSPLNEDIYSALYPQWKSIIKDMNIILVVGCPDPYDAMVREYAGKEFVIFDLLRFYDYSLRGYDIKLLIRKLLTHETSHLCLHTQYPLPASGDFVAALKHITFDEGFAHLLAFENNLRAFDFSSIIKEHYDQAFIKLLGAMKETDCKKQKVLLEECNSGPYWDKFAAISGKLFLAKHITNIENIYKGGIDNLISSMGLEP